ncbi:HAMP domain-containing histidine kinase [Gilvimarinus agarilyticus]|uniref:sensor histidine kinase n=1 Tax=unclassified Gilvimarinus TaxID=2642066 RepID=UPI001C095054|nr:MULTISPECIES: HAMP domain-containing sensor histidine kinase [unclassified Gilvimarinus]MBU2885117.1 HAMP domain-containing histidine kinase [Gilvimarinus agarilyticus]MDO6570015.1 HAMP domain-containing sensor histidine kinase [Gilvimarinus sp. 2_MG-2023]MDO6747282.1 HAMP domain-containing sensor histidine kinase [Gilvimarinus sp. 1_MG-2023]
MTDKGLPVDFSFVLASSVHDMKNSVGMLMQTIEELSASAATDNAEHNRQLSTLGYEAARINGDLVQLLALYRMENQRMLVQLEECYLDEIIGDQLARNDILFRSRNIAVEVDCGEDVCWYIDAELISGMLNNILVNAARYCLSRIKVTANIEDGVLHLIVADDGRGYPESMLTSPTVMRDSVSFTEGNTNLGLLFAQEIAKLHRRGDLHGYITLANGGVLSGGQIEVVLP